MIHGGISRVNHGFHHAFSCEFEVSLIKRAVISKDLNSSKYVTLQ